MAKHKLLSGRVKVTPAANVAADRYNYLALEQAEPNLGVANADGYVLTYSTSAPGNRSWQSSSLLSGGLVAQSAFATANNAEALSTAAYAHANAAFVKANTVGLHANAGFLAANTADQKAVTSGAYANSSYTHANAAFVAANTADQRAVTSGAYANSSYTHANAAFAAANSASGSSTDTFARAQANASFDVANSASSYANGAFAAANTADQKAVTSGAYANSAFGIANSASSYANGAFAAANSKFSSSGGTITGDTNITGNLTVVGATTYANTQTVLIADNILTLNAAIGQSAQPAVNAGIEIDRGAQPNAQFIWVESSGKWSANNGNGSIFIAAESAESYANGAFAAANVADQRAVTSGTYANSAFGVANSASSYANGAFAAANTADQRAVTSGAYANASYIHANAAFAYANTISGGSASDSIARAQANSSYLHANAAFDKANTGSKSTASATAPVSPSVGDMWYDTDTDVLLRYTNDGTSNNWIDITGPIIGRSTYVRPTYLITANAS